MTVQRAGRRSDKRRWLGGTVEPIDDERCLYRTGDDNLDWLAMRIAMLGYEFEVHEPPELVERLRELGARIERGTSATCAAPGS